MFGLKHGRWQEAGWVECSKNWNQACGKEGKSEQAGIAGGTYGFDRAFGDIDGSEARGTLDGSSLSVTSFGRAEVQF